MRYPKKYTVKEWSKFSWTMQEKLCARYTVILIDYKTKSERLRGVFSPKNINKKVDATVNIINKVSKTLEKLDGSKIKIFQGVSQKQYDSLLGDKKQNYSALMGKRDYSALVGRRSFL